MIFDCNKHTPTENYFALIQMVVPRPIAWVLSDNGNGSYNLAPFSFFNAIASNPPTIMISAGWKDEQTRKDTWINIEQRHKFVVHIPSVGDMKNVAASSATLDHGISEVDQLQMPMEKVEGQRLPKLKGPKLVMFCEKLSIQEIGLDKQALILGKVNQIWMSDDIAKVTNGRLVVDAKALDPLTRLGGPQYASLGEILTAKRPD
jgi:flavin reductase (DIM6/NTAB) family NADH-FMN oxidoreductase RutF